MSRRRATESAERKTEAAKMKNPERLDSRPLRVLIASRDARTRSALATLADQGAGQCELVSTCAQALDALVTPADIVVIDDTLPDATWRDVLPAALATNPRADVLVLADCLTLDFVVEAMRAGARDVLAHPLEEREARACLHASLRRACVTRETERELARLRRVNRRLRTDRSQMSEQVNVLCNDLAGAYQELAEQVSQMSLSSEFAAVIQHELDIEELLRKGLEFMLTRTGPTNAAVYLPTNHSDFSLGAYVNYDCSREEADVLLDHLAGIVPARFQHEKHVLWFETPAEIRTAVEGAAGWLDHSTMIVYPCRHKGETLAVLVFFRDANRRFSRELLPQVETMGKLFAEQLAKVIRVHHRRLTDEEHYGFGFDDDADEGFGGGLAA